MKGDSVVKEIQIKNFRSLKDTGMQTLSPITLPCRNNMLHTGLINVTVNAVFHLLDACV